MRILRGPWRGSSNDFVENLERMLMKSVEEWESWKDFNKDLEIIKMRILERFSWEFWNDSVENPERLRIRIRWKDLMKKLKGFWEDSDEYPGRIPLIFSGFSLESWEDSDKMVWFWWESWRNSDENPSSQDSQNQNPTKFSLKDVSHKNFWRNGHST